MKGVPDTEATDTAFRTAATRSFHTLLASMPIMFRTLRLVNLLTTFAGKSYAKLFTGNPLIDPFIGAFAGSLSFGIPVISYVVFSLLNGLVVGRLAPDESE